MAQARPNVVSSDNGKDQPRGQQKNLPSAAAANLWTKNLRGPPGMGSEELRDVVTTLQGVVHVSKVRAGKKSGVCLAVKFASLQDAEAAAETKLRGCHFTERHNNDRRCAPTVYVDRVRHDLAHEKPAVKVYSHDGAAEASSLGDDNDEHEEGQPRTATHSPGPQSAPTTATSAASTAKSTLAPATAGGVRNAHTAPARTVLFWDYDNINQGKCGGGVSTTEFVKKILDFLKERGIMPNESWDGHAYFVNGVTYPDNVVEQCSKLQVERYLCSKKREAADRELQRKLRDVAKERHQQGNDNRIVLISDDGDFIETVKEVRDQYQCPVHVIHHASGDHLFHLQAHAASTIDIKEIFPHFMCSLHNKKQTAENMIRLESGSFSCKESRPCQGAADTVLVEGEPCLVSTLVPNKQADLLRNPTDPSAPTTATTSTTTALAVAPATASQPQGTHQAQSSSPKPSPENFELVSYLPPIFGGGGLDLCKVEPYVLPGGDKNDSIFVCTAGMQALQARPAPGPFDIQPFWENPALNVRVQGLQIHATQIKRRSRNKLRRVAQFLLTMLEYQSNGILPLAIQVVPTQPEAGVLGADEVLTVRLCMQDPNEATLLIVMLHEKRLFSSQYELRHGPVTSSSSSSAGLKNWSLSAIDDVQMIQGRAEDLRQYAKLKNDECHFFAKHCGSAWPAQEVTHCSIVQVTRWSPPAVTQSSDEDC